MPTVAAGWRQGYLACTLGCLVLILAAAGVMTVAAVCEEGAVWIFFRALFRFRLSIQQQLVAAAM